jgi:hypothetical protein
MTFLKLSIVIILFIIAFSLGFHLLLADQELITHCSIVGKCTEGHMRRMSLFAFGLTAKLSPKA